ncbi:MAG TPA: hypothetical protein VKP65_15895 [Rhodothermales bacterium]|nr:hypothetical protein [Rhodothermales bacterium]
MAKPARIHELSTSSHIRSETEDSRLETSSEAIETLSKWDFLPEKERYLIPAIEGALEVIDGQPVFNLVWDTLARRHEHVDLPRHFVEKYVQHWTGAGATREMIAAGCAMLMDRNTRLAKPLLILNLIMEDLICDARSPEGT